MPHKRAKKSIREAHTAAAGYDNPPKSGDSIPHPNNPIASTSNSSNALPGQGIGVLAPPTATKKVRKKNDRIDEKRDSFGGRKDLNGMSKGAFRILNAVALREQYHQDKKRKREEEEKGKNPNQKREKLLAMPYESLRDFNHRVEMSMRGSIDTAIRGANSKKKEKERGKKKGVENEEDAEIREMEEENQRRNEEEPASRSEKAKKEDRKETVDPYAKRPPGARATEFKTASQIRRIDDVVQAPPTLKKGKRGQANITKMNEPLPASRMPVSGALKALMAAEREKAVRGYRELKEKRERESKGEAGP